LKFVDRFSKNIQIQSFVKIRPLGSELFRVDGRMDGRTDTANLIDAFRNFSKAPKIRLQIPQQWSKFRSQRCPDFPSKY